MKDERKFLHEIASPLTVLGFSLTNLEELLASGTPADLKKCASILSLNAGLLKKVETLIHQRRAKLRAKVLEE